MVRSALLRASRTMAAEPSFETHRYAMLLRMRAYSNGGADVAQVLRCRNGDYDVAAFTTFTTGGLAPTGVPNTRSKPAR